MDISGKKVIVAKTGFEDELVAMQEDSASFEQSKENFDKSCMLCTMYALDADCDACPIRQAMLATVTKWHGIPKDHPWVQAELALA